MLAGVQRYILDEFLVVQVPRTLVVHNRRLGTFYKLLQIVFLLVVVAYCVLSRVFLLPHNVEAWGVSIWPQGSGGSGDDAQGPQYCANTAAYAYVHETSGTHYAPTSCKPLSTGEAYSSLMDGVVFLATFAADDTIWEGAGNQCGPSAERECVARNATTSATYREAGGICSCTIHEQFLVQNPEQQRVRLVYGFEVDLSDGHRLDLLRGGIVAPTMIQGPQNAMEQGTSDLETKFIASDGGQCQFGGKPTWQLSEAVGGISGTLHELLHCAGVSLDSNPEDLVAGATLPSSPPHLRTQGLRLELHMNFHEDLLGRMFCDIRVVATPVTTAVWTSNVQPWGGSGSGSTARAQYSRSAHGVALSARVTGTIYTFSWVQVVRGLVDVTVVLSIPRFIITFTAMYLMGLVSEVYRSSAQTKLSVFGKFHHSVAKLILSEVAFRGLVGDFEAPTEELPGVTPKMFLNRLKDIFKDHYDAGILDAEELGKMCTVIFNVMDTAGTGKISCSEFIEACTDDCDIDMNRLAIFFDKDQKLGAIRWLLDDTHVVSKSRAKLSCLTTTDLQDVSSRCTPALEGSGEFDFEVTTSNWQMESKLDEQPAGEVSQEAQQQQQPRSSGWRNSHRAQGVEQDVENRIRALERYCEEALEALRAAVILQPPLVGARHASDTADVAAWCHVLARHAPTSLPPSSPGGSKNKKARQHAHSSIAGPESPLLRRDSTAIFTAQGDVSVEGSMHAPAADYERGEEGRRQRSRQTDLALAAQDWSPECVADAHRRGSDFTL